MTTNTSQDEKEFLHDLSNLLTKVQGRNMIASMKVDKVEVEELKELLALTQTHIDSMVKVVNQRKTEIRESLKL